MEYQKPEAVVCPGNFEGVYLASGSSAEECNVKIITKQLTTQNGKYVAKIAWEHSLTGHMVSEIFLHLTFNQNVKFITDWDWVTPKGSNSGTSITIRYSDDNGHLNNGYVDLRFESEPGLQLVDVSATEH